ncbi:MAG: hypothetical protein M1840_004062 [Geoglossum simile]|nr:MAG: hypothetical protein M1840_004062 [Geoglossum simile]
MAFLFKSKRHHPSSAVQPGQPLGLSGSNSSIPSTNGASAGVLQKERDRGGANQTPTPSSSVNNSLKSLGGADTPSPEQKGMLERANREQQGPATNGLSGPPLATNPNASLYPWSQRRLQISSSHLSPFPRYGHAANSLSSKEGDIYLMGGLIKSQTVRGDLWIVEAGGGTLACYPLNTAPEGPGPRVGHSSLLVGNAFIVYGGDTTMDDRDVLDNNLYLLNTSTRQWSRAAPAGSRPRGRYGHTLNILGSKIYIFGGQVEGSFFNDLVAFDLNGLQASNNQWEFLVPNSTDERPPAGDIPPARTNHTVISWNDKLFLFGGTNGFQWFNDVWSYDPRSNLWTQLDCIGYIPTAREGHAAALVNDVMYIFGGRSEDGSDLGDLASFRISSRRWYTFQNMGPSPSPRSGHSMTTFNKQIIVLGGEPSTQPREPSDLGLVYILDTNKIRYPNDQQAQNTPSGERTGGTRRPSGGDKSGYPQPRPGPGPGREGLTGTPDIQKRINPGPRESVAGTNPFMKDTAPINGSGPGSRLPRASMAQAPSGPPPQQSAPPPRANGVPPQQRSKTPTKGYGPSVDTRAATLTSEKDKENSPPAARDSPSSREGSLSNGVRNPAQQQQPKGTPNQKTTGESTTNGNPGPGRSRSRQARQQSSGDSFNESIMAAPVSERVAPAGQQRAGSNSGQRGNHKKNPSDNQLPLESSPLDDASTKELEAVKRTNAWYASELVLARRAGYVPNLSNNAVLDTRAPDSFSEDERPLIEALLTMRAELARVQESIDSQSSQTAKKIAEIERQRDAAISEAVYAKAKLAAHGGSNSSTPQPEGSSRDLASIDADRSTEMNRKLASSLGTQSELRIKLESLTAEKESERQARQLADEAATAAQKRVAELDVYRHQSASELESLKAELFHAEKLAREESAACAEAVATSRVLKLDKEELSARLEEALGSSREHTGIFSSLKDAISASEEKVRLLERKLEGERELREGIERRLLQLRAEHEERTTELESATRRLRDAEELSERHASEAAKHREAVLSGLGKVTNRDLGSVVGSAADGRVIILQGQVDAAKALVRKSQTATDAASEKLRRAEERIAGLEAYQEQASREALTIRKQMQNAVKETQTLQAQNAEIREKLANQQLDANAIAVQHGALKDLLGERGISASDARRSRSIPSPGSGFGTPEQSRLRDLEQQLEASLKAHHETKTSFEMREQEAEKLYREKLEQLEHDYQSAVHYVKGTEKMLKKMKDELSKYKTQNARLQAGLEQAQEAHTAKSLEMATSAEWEKERESLKKEIGALQEKVKDSVSKLEKRIEDLQAQLKAAHQKSDQYREHDTQTQREYADYSKRTTADLEQLKTENALLETRALDAEKKVSLLLDQFETSVDNYRRQSRQVDLNGIGGHDATINRNGRDSISQESLFAPDNRNSVALDSLASELDALRTQWETTKSNNYRLSSIFDFEKTPTSGDGGELSTSLAKWRQRLDLEEQQEGEKKASQQGSPTEPPVVNPKKVDQAGEPVHTQ